MIRARPSISAGTSDATPSISDSKRRDQRPNLLALVATTALHFLTRPMGGIMGRRAHLRRSLMSFDGESAPIFVWRDDVNWHEVLKTRSINGPLEPTIYGTT